MSTEGYGQWAEHYRQGMWTHVLPLPHNAKTPPPGGYTGKTAKTPDDAKIAEWIAQHPRGNLALRMPGDILGIDVDDYPYEYIDKQTGQLVQGYKTGGAVLQLLEAQLGPLPATWRSSSRGDGPSGIRFYRVPSGLLWGDFGLHLEGIWWGHRYAVVWPSVNPDSGQRYLWIDDTSDEPEWGAPPPKVTDLAELPEPWVARFGRPADTPRPAASTAVARTPGTAVARDDRERRTFTREQAARYVETEGLEPLRAATHGNINNKMNDAATVLSHFVPAFWSPAAAHALIWDAARAAGYDHPMSATKTIDSGLSTVSWVAELVSVPSPPPGGARTRPRGSEDDPWPTEAPDDPLPPETSGFWDARPELAYIRDFALSRYAVPWAVLGAALARAVACVEPNIQLPAVIGTEASLNLFVGLVGPSGGGKDIAVGVAEALLLPTDGHYPVPLDVIPLGSGEGLSHIFMKRPPKLSKNKKSTATDDDSAMIGLAFNPEGDAPIQYRTRALVNIAEIDTMGSLSQRRGSTVGGQLRQAWSGSQLGFQYVDVEKRMIVPKHAYRMCLTAGIQPGRAGALLDETDGGTPQRFLWLPASDPTLEEPTDEQIDNPPPPLPGVDWSPPVYRAGMVLYQVCTTARRTIVRAHFARRRADADALDGHALLNRLKTAAALALLRDERPERQCTVTEEDWELSGVVMAVSDRTRAGVQRVLAEQARLENEQKGRADARRALVAGEVVEDVEHKKALAWVRRKVGPEWVTERSLTQDGRRVRARLKDALAELVTAGDLEMGEYKSGTQSGRHYRKSQTNSE